MTSLARFKQALRGEMPEKKSDEWLEQATEVEVNDEAQITTEEPIEVVIDPESMTKAELDSYAAEQHGIQLDRRQSKINMIAEFIQKLKEKN